jgi:hypothetical protein
VPEATAHGAEILGTKSATEGIHVFFMPPRCSGSADVVRPRGCRYPARSPGMTRLPCHRIKKRR